MENYKKYTESVDVTNIMNPELAKAVEAVKSSGFNIFEVSKKKRGEVTVLYESTEDDVNNTFTTTIDSIIETIKEELNDIYIEYDLTEEDINNYLMVLKAELNNGNVVRVGNDEGTLRKWTIIP